MTTLTQPLPPRVAVLPDLITVVVDEEDGLLGIRGNPHWCRFARAIRRALVLLGYQIDEVMVGACIGGFSVVSMELLSQHPQLFRLDGPVADQIYEYDNGGNPPPCTVVLTRLP